MKSKDVLLLKYLIDKKNDELNILKISNALKINYKNTHSIIKRLEKKNLVKLKSFGRANRIMLIHKMHPLIFEAEYNRRKELLKNKSLAVMFNTLKNAIKSKFYLLLVFGSYAKNKQTKNSDIDLIFIVPNGTEESFEEEVNQASISLPLPIHSLVFSEEQFLEMIYTRDSNVGKEALKNNIILYGIETYYEMKLNDQ